MLHILARLKRVNAEALAKNQHVNLPYKTFLEESQL